MRAVGMLAVVVAVAGCAGPDPEPPAAGGEVVVAEDKPPPAAVGVPAVLDPLPPAAVPKDAPPALAAVFEERNQRHRREAGARLTIAAKWVRDPGLEQAIRVEWAIDYDGPRRPFAIATPGRGTDPAVAHFWYLQPDGTAAAYARAVGGGVMPGLQPRKQRDWFSVAADGKPVAGRLEKGGSSLGGPFRDRRPRPGDPPLWVQLEYEARDRGDGVDWVYDEATNRTTRGAAWAFDAWTGRLWSPVVEVAAE